MGKVLVVDDEIDICVLLSRQLQKHGVKAEYALNLSDAIQMATKSQYNLYIIDLNLAGRSGYELVEKLKEMDQQAKIIMISAHDSEAENAIHRGADYFVAKPLSKKSIANALEQIHFT